MYEEGFDYSSVVPWGEQLNKLFTEDQKQRNFNENEEPVYLLYPPFFKRVGSFERDLGAISPQSMQFSYYPIFPPPILYSSIPPPTQKPIFHVYNGKGPDCSNANICDISNISDSGVGRLTAEERKRKIEKYKAKKGSRKFINKAYPCRREAAIVRPRLHGRFISKYSKEELARNTLMKQSKPFTKKPFHIEKNVK